MEHIILGILLIANLAATVWNATRRGEPVVTPTVDPKAPKNAPDNSRFVALEDPVERNATWYNRGGSNSANNMQRPGGFAR